ncbi:MAG TPA: AI-2E family transporter [Candidatus Kapabacteria bacterium]|jgi:predicted PurR-regulated permease PerM|nr:AI-2E family transporter [Candidatus Kapabacteria bacterium]
MTTTSRSVTLPLLAIAIVIVGAALHELRPVMLPFVVALFLSNIFRPLIVYLTNRHVPMAVALLLVFVLVGAVLLMVTLVAISSVQSLIAALPRYEARWNETILPGIQHLLDGAPQSVQDQLKDLKWSNVVQVSAILSVIYAGAGGFMSVLSGLGLILLFMLFILGGHGLFERKIRAAYPDHAESLTNVIRKIDEKTERYFITVTLMNLVSGIIATIILSAFGVDLALLWGLVTFLLCFIPTIGSIIALALPILVAFLQFGSLGTAIEVAITLIVIEFLWGSVLTPRIMGSSMDLSPLLVLLALIFWGWIWGPWGMIFSVPIMAMIKIVFESIPATKSIGILMGAKA